MWLRSLCSEVHPKTSVWDFRVSPDWNDLLCPGLPSFQKHTVYSICCICCTKCQCLRCGWACPFQKTESCRHARIVRVWYLAELVSPSATAVHRVRRQFLTSCNGGNWTDCDCFHWMLCCWQCQWPVASETDWTPVSRPSHVMSL